MDGLIMLADYVDEFMPACGACAICGGDDARHRVVDAMIERVNAGESTASVARDYGYPSTLVERLVRDATLEEAAACGFCENGVGADGSRCAHCAGTGRQLTPEEWFLAFTDAEGLS